MYIKYVFKRRPDDGYGCANLYAGKVKIAVERKLPYQNKEGSFSIGFLIPAIETIYGDDRNELKSRAVVLCKEWFNKTQE